MRSLGAFVRFDILKSAERLDLANEINSISHERQSI